ncbi:hypothetical protein D3C75_801140 [compost metagenome]
MKTIFLLTLKAAPRDPYLLFWSILLPVGGTIGLGLLIGQPEYPLRIMTGMMAVGMLFYAFSTTSFAILGQRRRGVYNPLRVTPMPLWRYICGVSGAWTLISLSCGLLVLGAGTIFFQLGIPAFARFNPFQWFLDGLRGALSLDPGIWLVSLGLLLILLLAALALAVRTFRFSDV